MAKGQNLHVVNPFPWAPPEQRARVKRTTALVDRFLRAPESECCTSTEASLAVHLIADSFHEFGRLVPHQCPTPWSELVVSEWLAFMLCLPGPVWFDHAGVLHAAGCFYRFLARCGDVSAETAERVSARIAEQREDFSRRVSYAMVKPSRRERRALEALRRRKAS